MQQQLKELLWAFLANNNPDVLLGLQEEVTVTAHIDTKVDSVMALVNKLSNQGIPQYIILETCMEALTWEYRPSRFSFIRSVLEDEFPKAFGPMKESGILTYEITNIIVSCEAIFEHFSFTQENEENRQLRYAIIGQIDGYLNQ